MAQKQFYRHFETKGYLHPDCLKCGKCVLACPTKITTLVNPTTKRQYES